MSVNEESTACVNRSSAGYDMGGSPTDLCGQSAVLGEGFRSLSGRVSKEEEERILVGTPPE